MSYRLRKSGLIGKTVTILPADFRPAAQIETRELTVIPATASAPAEVVPSSEHSVARIKVRPGERILTKEEFHRLANVPAYQVWLASIENVNTRNAYANDLKEFLKLVPLDTPDEFRRVAQSHPRCADAHRARQRR